MKEIRIYKSVWKGIRLMLLASVFVVVILNEVGIFDRSLGADIINWEIIRDAYIGRVNKEQFICLVIDEAYEPSQNKSAFYKKVSAINKEMGFQELNIHTSNLSMKEDKLIRLITEMIHADKTKRSELIGIATHQ